MSLRFKTFPYKLHYKDDTLLEINDYSNTKILDFFDMISYICYTDFFTPRDEDNNNISKLTLYIPVNNFKSFNNIKNDVELLLFYMTNGEHWNINFVKEKIKKKIIRTQRVLLEKGNYNSIALLSGGLDSMAGSVIEKNNKTIFVTFGSNNIELKNSKDIFKNLIKTDNNAHVIIKKLQINSAKHYTQRTRSLIFIASSLIFADYYGIEKVKIYENGIMSLNPRFNFSRRVTKTTNQKTLYIINEILKKLEININIENPFKYKTKADIIKIIPKNYSEKIIKSTRTCSKNSGIIHFKNKSSGNFHCGVCIACVLRQIGMINAKRKDTNYLLPPKLYKLKDIINLERNISNHKKIEKEIKASIYKFNEKRSLIEYYKSFYKNIKEGTIYNYFDMKKEYYNDEDWLVKINQLLKRFSKEIEIYLANMGVELR